MKSEQQQESATKKPPTWRRQKRISLGWFLLGMCGLVRGLGVRAEFLCARVRNDVGATFASASMSATKYPSEEEARHPCEAESPQGGGNVQLRAFTRHGT